MNRYYNSKDGHTYFYHEGILAACPTMTDGSIDIENELIYVSEFCYPLKRKERIRIERLLSSKVTV